MPRIFAPREAGLAIPMPDRGNRLMPACGAAVDLASPYYRRLFDDGDIVEVKNKNSLAAEARGAANRK